MTTRTVIRMGHPTLKLVAEKVPESEIKTPEFKSLLQDLYDTMKEEGGIGIAAPQIDVSLQVALIDIPKNSERYGKLPESPLIVIINPIITYLTEEMQEFYEGCLSVPGLRGKVQRPKKIQVDYVDEHGASQVIIAEDFLATVFQHELDHLFGKLYVERMTDLSTLSFIEEFDQFQKKASTIE
jgi:peptide deformylase